MGKEQIKKVNFQTVFPFLGLIAVLLFFSNFHRGKIIYRTESEGGAE